MYCTTTCNDHKCTVLHHFLSWPQVYCTVPLPFLTTTSQVYCTTTCNDHKCCTAPLPLLTTSVLYHYLSWPQVYCTTTYPDHKCTVSLPVLTTSVLYHYLSWPQVYCTTTYPEHKCTVPLPILTTSVLYHYLSWPHVYCITTCPDHKCTVPLPILNTSVLYYYLSWPQVSPRINREWMLNTRKSLYKIYLNFYVNSQIDFGILAKFSLAHSFINQLWWKFKWMLTVIKIVHKMKHDKVTFMLWWVFLISFT